MSRPGPGRRLLAIVIVCLVLPYALSPIYRFPVSRPFTGAYLWNPYEGARGRWLRANLHAHGRAWGGVTNGQQSDAEVIAAYRAAGYDIAGISDYQSIATTDTMPTVPLYEHGFNLGKHHQLAIGAQSVDWIDFPLWQGVHQKQYVINRLKQSSALVMLNHPAKLHSYTEEDLARLAGYDLIEVANGQVMAEERWDAALSSGHAVWGVGADDTHDVTDPDRTAVAWIMINADSTSRADLVNALRAGRSYTVSRTANTPTAGRLALASAVVKDGTLTLICLGEPATFSFVGQNGAIRGTVANAMSASYTFTPADTYIRTAVRGTQTVLFLNPVLRSDGFGPATPVAEVDPIWTWLLRFTIVAGCAAILWRVRR